MQFPVGLLLLTFALLLQGARCKTTVTPHTVQAADALADAIAEAEADNMAHLGEVVVSNGEETEPYVERSDLHNGSMEGILNGIEEELKEDGVKPTGNVADIMMELAKEYENGTRQGVPTYHHSPLDVGHSNTTHSLIDKRQAHRLRDRWEKGILPYWFTEQVPEWGRNAIRAAMKFIEDKTCLKFPPWSKTVYAEYDLPHTAYINFIIGSQCSSGIGRNRWSDRSDVSCCNDYWIALHELGHRLGLDHEQNHPKRDFYVEIHPENVAASKLSSFYVQSHSQPYTSGVEVHPYDYGSIMHYGMYDFSNNGLPALSIKDKRDEFLLENRETSLSHYDLMGINNYYKCTAKCPADKRELKCQNDGFIHDCKCYCSQLFSGELCERLNSPDCGGIIELTESNLSINISSPGYPQTHNNERCIWYIKGPEGKHMVLDIDNLDLEHDSKGGCINSLEIRRTLIAQPGEKFCGKGAKSSVISYAGFIILVLHTGQTGMRNGFSSAVRLVSDAEQCYNTADSGSSYRGKVDYSQQYHKCIPWDEVKHCPVNGLASRYIHSGLMGHSYCRNPNNLLRPWCYINKDCGFDFCDVCGIGKCHDISANCVERVAKDPQYCSTGNGFRVCHKTCNFCGRGHQKPVSSCSKPDLTDKNAVIDPSYENQATFEFGEKLKMECKEKIDDELITRELTCTTDGKFVGDSVVCCAGTACNDGYSRYKDGCYKLAGKDAFFGFPCEDLRGSYGKLVGISDDAENNFVKKLIGGSPAWIGYSNYHVPDAKYEWEDGVNRTYTNWRPDEPSRSGSDDNCTIMEVDGTWDDIYCWTYHYGVCEKHNKVFKANCSCADEYPKCTELIEKNYKVCKVYQEYSFMHCHSSCGNCGAVADCKNPGTVPNTVQKTTVESTKTGNYYEYECSIGYGLASGNLGRTCLKDGTLSGTAPVCEPYVGNAVQQRTTHDASTSVEYMYIERTTSMTFPIPGTVRAWKLYSNSAADITMMVVRPVAGSDTKFTVVGMNTLKAPDGNMAVIPVATAARISVKAGDMIAWYYLPGSYPTIPQSVCKSSDVKIIWAGKGPFTTGQEVSGTVAAGRACRTYSIGALLNYDTVRDEPEDVSSLPRRDGHQ